MPIIKQSFKVDLFQLKYARDAIGLLKSIQDGHARDLGLQLIEDFPYQKVAEESFDGELPSAVLTKDHHFVETWRSEFCLLTIPQWELVMRVMKRAINEDEKEQLKGVL